MSTPCYDTVILSDLHLGSEVSRAQAALQMLKAVSFSRLILLGDIFCDLNFRRLKKEHWQFLGYIRKLSNPKRGITVVWVEGNHDLGLSDVMSHLVGIDVGQAFQGAHLAEHGRRPAAQLGEVVAPQGVLVLGVGAPAARAALALPDGLSPHAVPQGRWPQKKPMP